MEPIGYMDCDRCQLCGEDIEPDDVKKAAHLATHETKGDIERAGPRVGWRLCFGRSFAPVPDGSPAAGVKAGKERAPREGGARHPAVALSPRRVGGASHVGVASSCGTPPAQDWPC